MTLLLNVDCDARTGWEGYDVVVNRVARDATTGTLEKNAGGWMWEKAGEVNMAVAGNEVQIAVPRDALGLRPEEGELRIDFKWVDNTPASGDILDFIDLGDTAPNGRFAYRYEECSGNEADLADDPKERTMADGDEVLQGDELASKLKSGVVFKSRDGVVDASLRLAAEDMQWWRDAKFGMFIHWGLYAISARGEWVMHGEQIPADEYAKLADEFVPRNFDADAWAQVAKDAGMRYMVLTARHHDGFALWNSPSSYRDFCSTKTASRRDFVAEYVAACRESGLRVGLYYSPMDWRFPGYFQPRELADNAALMKQQGYGQVRELMSQYGKIDILWYDGSWLAHKGNDADAAWFWEPLKLNAMVRQHQPKVVISPRSGWEGDFQCDEGGHEIVGPIIHRPWEKCLNLNQSSWGYNTHQNLMFLDQIVSMLINVIGRGGNVLLNVGPDRNGVIPETHVKRLAEVGRWLKTNGKSIYDTRPGPLQPVDHVYCTTHNGNRVYVHVLDWGPRGTVELPGLKQKIVSFSALSGEALLCAQSSDRIELSLPRKAGNRLPIVVELVLDAPVFTTGIPGE